MNGSPVIDRLLTGIVLEPGCEEEVLRLRRDARERAAVHRRASLVYAGATMGAAIIGFMLAKPLPIMLASAACALGLWIVHKHRVELVALDDVIDRCDRMLALGDQTSPPISPDATSGRRAPC